MTREEFFNKLNAGAKWNVGVSIARTNPLPLDANEIFESVEKMEEYIATNLLAYPGQLVVVLGTNETAAYLVKTVGGNGKGYSKLAATSGSGDVNEQLEALSNRLTQIENRFTAAGVANAAVKAEQDGAGNVISTTYATKTELTAAVTGSVQYLDTVATDSAVSALKPNSKGDFARASNSFTLSAANSSTGVAVSIHAGDLLICASTGTPNTWTVSHGGEEGVVSISNGTGIAVNNTNPASPVISLTSDYVNEIAKITDKVDKVEGKGLSTEDFTTDEKEKLANIEPQATRVIVDSELTSTGTNPVQGKAIYSTINTLETKVDQKLDAADYIVDSELTETGTNPVQGKAIYAKFSALETSVSGKVDKEKGKGLSTNDFTTAEKNKLAGLSNYILKAATSEALGGIKIGYSGTDERTYAVQLDTNSKAYVYVPWESDTNQKITAKSGGSNVAFGVDDTIEIVAGEHVTVTPDTAHKTITIASTDTVYTHPAGSAPSKASGLYKFSTDATSHISSVTEVIKKDITDLGIPEDDTWREVKVNDTAIDGAAPLNLKNGTNISITYDSSGNVTINHASQGTAAQNSTTATAQSGGTINFGSTFYVPKFAIDSNGHTRDLGRISYTLPTPDAYSLPVATQTTLGGIKAGNGDNFSSGAEGTTKNYKAKVEVDNDGLATVNLQHLVHDSDQADHSLGWGIEAGYTYIDVVRLSTDKLVQGTNTLIINGGGAEW